MGSRGSNSLSSKLTSVPDNSKNINGAMPIEEAMKNTNPHFSEGKEYQKNCQRCVLAYEMNRRGLKCTAKPRILHKADLFAEEWFKNLRNQGCKTEFWSSKNRTGVIRTVKATMAKYGENSRAICYIKWAKGSAHVFNLEYKNNKVRCIDAQVGKEYSLRDRFKGTKSNYFGL